MKSTCDYLKRKAFVKGQLQVYLDKKTFDDWQKEADKAQKDKGYMAVIEVRKKQLLDDIYAMPAYLKHASARLSIKSLEESLIWTAALAAAILELRQKGGC